MKAPTNDEVKTARDKAMLTQTQAAAVIHATLGGWQKWEAGTRHMHPAFWELFLIKTNQIK